MALHKFEGDEKPGRTEYKGKRRVMLIFSKHLPFKLDIINHRSYHHNLEDFLQMIVSRDLF